MVLLYERSFYENCHKRVSFKIFQALDFAEFHFTTSKIDVTQNELDVERVKKW